MSAGHLSVAAGASHVGERPVEHVADVDPRVGRAGAELHRVVDEAEDDAGFDAFDLGEIIRRLRDGVELGRPAGVAEECRPPDGPVVDGVDRRLADGGVGELAQEFEVEPGVESSGGGELGAGRSPGGTSASRAESRR